MIDEINAKNPDQYIDDGQYHKFVWDRDWGSFNLYLDKTRPTLYWDYTINDQSYLGQSKLDNDTYDAFNELDTFLAG
jgi:hypothetical protein